MAQEQKPIVAFSHVSFAYDGGGPDILSEVSVALPEHSFTAIVGPSGGGKSTLLRLIIGLSKPTVGSIANTANTRMVFQNGALLPWRTVIDNVLIGCVGLKLSKSAQRRKAMELLRELGISDWAHAYPRELSGGQRQRVGIARALIAEPELLLLDEPFSALDIETTNALAEELLTILGKRAMTMVMVSHSIEDAVVLADRVLVCAKGTIQDDVSVPLARPRVRTSTEVQALTTQIKLLVQRAHR